MVYPIPSDEAGTKPEQIGFHRVTLLDLDAKPFKFGDLIQSHLLLIFLRNLADS